MTPGPRLSLRRSLETVAGRRAYARRLFATIADRYDLITVLLPRAEVHGSSPATCWRCRLPMPDSTRRYPGAHSVAALFRQEGFVESEHRPVFGGLMAINIAAAGDISISR